MSDPSLTPSLRRLSPELRFVAACCRWPQEDVVETLRERAARVGDWERVAAIVKRQRVQGLVAHAIRGADLRFDDGVRAQLLAEGDAIARGSLAGAAETLRINRLLAAEGIDRLFLKGAPLAMLAYGTLAYKKSIDIDLLVTRDELVRTAALLRSAGYRCVDPEGLSDEQFAVWAEHYRESTWINAARGTVVDLHSQLSDNPLWMPGIDACSPAQAVAITHGHAAPTLQDATLFAYLCMHGAVHSWARLKWIADVSALLHGRSDAELTAWFEHAEALGVGHCAGQALLLCNDVLLTPLPPTLVARCRARWVDRALLRLAIGAFGERQEVREPGPALLSNIPVRLATFLFQPTLGHARHQLRALLANPESRARSDGRRADALYTLGAVGRIIRRKIDLMAQRRRERSTGSPRD